jgi:hypothetical protein
MSRLDSPQQQPGDGAARVAPGVVPVSIAPTRRQIDNKFPELGFDINIGDLPFYEVLLTTERSLFDPDRQQHRNRSNFYVSRWDTEPPRLTRAVGRPARYMVPPAVLQAFAQSKPKAIFYTVIAYAGEEGRDPAFAHDPARLSAEAPSVTVSGEFTGQTLSTVLGIPAHMLMRVGEPRPSDRANSYGANAQGLGAAAEEDDAGEGEDGYQASAHGLSEEWDDDEWEGAEAYAVAGEDDDEYPQDGYELQKAKSKSQSYNDDEEEDELWGAAASARAYGEDEDEFYSDGFEHAGPIRPAQALQSMAQESMFPNEMGEPEDLQDSESGYEGGGLSSGDDEYDYAASLSVEPDIDAGSSALEEDDEDYASEPAYAAGAYGGKGNGHGNGNGHGYAASAQYADQYGAGDDYSSGLSYDDGYGAQEGGSFRPQSSHAASYGDEAEMAFGALDDGSKLEAAIDKKSMTEEEYRKIKEKVRIIEHITKDESGKALYKAVNRDGEFEGKFGQDHPAYQKFHIGLSYGIIQFTQDSGELGSLLKLMKQKDEKTFVDTFGPHQQELINTTTAKGPSSKETPGGRSARVQKVGGHDLWDDEWVRRFQQASDHVPFRAAQIELAAKDFLDPMLPFAKSLGLTTDRALTIVVDRAVQMGAGRARRIIIGAVGPIKTPALLQQALAALGQADLKSFQKAKGLKDDGDLGPWTHAALVEELRKLGPGASPVPMPSTKEMLEAIVRYTAGEKWGGRVKRIAEATAGFDDKPVQL